MTLIQLARILKMWDGLKHEERLFVAWGFRHDGSELPRKVLEDRKLYTREVREFLKAIEEAGVDLKKLRPAFF